MSKRCLFLGFSVFALSVIAILMLGALVSPVDAAPREINVAAAADLSIALPEIAYAYEKTSGVVAEAFFWSFWSFDSTNSKRSAV